jgi:hypothetical protein
MLSPMQLIIIKLNQELTKQKKKLKIMVCKNATIIRFSKSGSIVRYRTENCCKDVRNVCYLCNDRYTTFEILQFNPS